MAKSKPKATSRPIGDLEEGQPGEKPHIGTFAVIALVVIIAIAFLLYFKPLEKIGVGTPNPTQSYATPVPTYAPIVVPTAVITATPTPSQVAAPSASQEPTSTPKPICSGFEACGAVDSCCPLQNECDAISDGDCSLYALGTDLHTTNNFTVSVDAYSLTTCNGNPYLMVQFSSRNDDTEKHFFASSYMTIYNFKNNNLETPRPIQCPESSVAPFEGGDFQPGQARSGAVYFTYNENEFTLNDKIRLAFYLRGGNYLNARRTFMALQQPQ